MAKTSCICCGRQIGFLSGSEKLFDDDDTIVCSSCFSKFGSRYNLLKNTSTNREKLDENLKSAIRTVHEAGFDEKGTSYILAALQRVYTEESTKLGTDGEADRFAQEQVRQEEELKRQQETQKNAIMQSYDDNRKDFIVTTSPQIEGAMIKRYLGLVSGSVIVQGNALSEFEKRGSGPFTKNDNGFLGKLYEAQNRAIEQMKHNALLLGANAIISVNMNYPITDFTSIKMLNSMVASSFACIVNGTAVVFEKKFN